MARFKIGQEIVCLAKKWHNVLGPSYGPAFNEIVTVEKYIGEFAGFTFIKLVEHTDYYNEADFEPLVSDRVLEKELATIPNYVVGCITMLLILLAGCSDPMQDDCSELRERYVAARQEWSVLRDTQVDVDTMPEALKEMKRQLDLCELSAAGQGGGLHADEGFLASACSLRCAACSLSVGGLTFCNWSDLFGGQKVRPKPPLDW